MFIAILMIVAGAALALCFGYAGWQVLYHPEKVNALTYILENISTQTKVPALTAKMQDGRMAEYQLSPAMKMFGLAYLFVAGLSMLISIARCMSDIGVHIIKALNPPPVAPAQQKKRPAPAQPAAVDPANPPPAL
jgi:hypothetical protein